MLDPFIVVTVGVALVAFAWSAPLAATAFVVMGSIPFYAALHLLRLSTSAELAGSVFGGIGSVALLRLALAGRLTPGRLQAATLFLGFVLLWYVRWFQDPATAEGLAFAQRSRAFMYAFAVVPFLSGVLLRDLAEVRRLLGWLAGWGALAIFIVGLYFVTGQPSQTPLENRWQPIPALSPIFLAIDVGFGALALGLFLRERRGAGWVALLVLVTLAAGGLMAAVGQRGPFLFFTLAVTLQLLLAPGATRWGRWLVAGVACAAVAWAVTIGGGDDSASRIFRAGSYTSEGNVDRLAIITAAVKLIPEHPLLGWGGSLAGRPLDYGVWFYSHQTMLDPLIETGLVGALLVWSLILLVLLRAVRVAAGRTRAALAVRAYAPLFVFLFLESQVSSHISATREMWLATGMLVALVESAAAAGGEPEDLEPASDLA